MVTLYVQLYPFNNKIIPSFYKQKRLKSHRVERILIKEASRFHLLKFYKNYLKLVFLKKLLK